MMDEHWFWSILSMACVGWYSLVTIYVAVKGIREIREMLGRLSAGRDTHST